jgi:hypothetical protein
MHKKLIPKSNNCVGTVSSYIVLPRLLRPIWIAWSLRVVARSDKTILDSGSRIPLSFLHLELSSIPLPPQLRRFSLVGGKRSGGKTNRAAGGGPRSLFIAAGGAASTRRVRGHLLVRRMSMRPIRPGWEEIPSKIIVGEVLHQHLPTSVSQFCEVSTLIDSHHGSCFVVLLWRFWDLSCADFFCFLVSLSGDGTLHRCSRMCDLFCRWYVGPDLLGSMGFLPFVTCTLASDSTQVGFVTYLQLEAVATCCIFIIHESKLGGQINFVRHMLHEH